MNATETDDIIDFSASVSTNDHAIAWFRGFNVIHSTVNCKRCERPMKEIEKKQNKFNKKVWHCPGCTHQQSICTDSMFSHSKQSLRLIAFILYFFAIDIPAFTVKRMLRSSFRAVTYSTILEYYHIFQDRISAYLIENPSYFEGQQGDVTVGAIEDDVEISTLDEEVEVDESWFGKKRKYNRGTGARKTTMVFGIVQKKGKKCALYVIPNNRRQTLEELIKKHISKTCVIHHDGLASYDYLHELEYKHKVVNHSKEFKAADGACTNTVEGLWGLLKARITRMHGLKSENRLAAVLDEFSFRQNHQRKDHFVEDMMKVMVMK